MTHELKIIPEFFQPVKDGEKTFEVRINDRDFKVGDIIRLREYLPNIMTYTGREFFCIITYILDDKRFCKEGYVVFSFMAL